MSELVRLGVIGTGMMGCEHIRNVMALDGAQVTAVSDPHPQSLEWARANLGDVRAAEFADHRELLASGLVDGVIVASPNFTHASVLSDVHATDLPVLVEKPMCTTIDDCREVVRAANSRRAITWVGLEYRYMAPIAALVSEVRSGRIGDVKMIAIREHRFPFLVKVDNWNRFSRNTGGTLVEKCCHFFDLMNLVAGSRPRRVMASGGQDVNHLDEVYDGERSDILDNAFVIVEYDNGIRANLDLCMFAEASSNEQELSVVGTLGKVEAAVPGDGSIRVGRRADRSVTPVASPIDERVAHVGFHFGASFIEVARFCEAIRSGGRPDVDVNAGLWSVAVGVAAHRSIDEGRPVSMDELGV
ncbi:MAG: oxidoreductase [Acidimicrobiales bacterium mtb01]|nr:Gfo/Idh/MocA family oxidoreductase [Actinomycetota bacterium]TEX46710.1 MAG: oxidoreductase [Acidimicrobiales bacterium mtb01]